MDIKDVENLVQLARIELTDEEKTEILQDMGSILGYIKQIEEVEVEDTDPELVLRNVWREDVLEPRDFSAELVTGQFPDSQDNFLKVKKIL